jgi:penicillin-binding protein 1A
MYRMPQYKRLEQRAAAQAVARPGGRRQLDDEWLRTGMTADQRDDMVFEERRRLRWPWRLLGYLVILGVWVALIGGGAVLWLARDLPRPEDALAASRRPSLTLEDHSGRVFASYGDVVGDPVRLDDLPPYLPAAAVAVEDRRFWSHHGIDLVGVLRAVVVNLRAGHVVQGGSTITQQVAKNLFLSNARTFRRKVQEVLLTLWLEAHFSKREILEIYLNRVYLGAGAWGVDAAARLYFGVPARKLSLWQAAVIAGLPRAPSRFNPRANPDAAEARAKEVLAAMVDTGAIAQPQADQAAAQIEFVDPPGNAAWFADWVAQESETLVPEDTDAVLHTTLDSKLQEVATAKLAALLDGPGQAAKVGQGAVVALDAATGAVRAMVGGHQHKAGGYNRAVLARRQAGSTFKPFVYLAALEAGAKPEDHVLDAPLRLGNWSPSNYDGRFHGDVTLEEALAESLNTAAVRVAIQAGGPAAVARTAHKLGIEGKLPDNLTIALGTGDVGVLELTAAYAPFCNGGLRVTPTGTETVTADGHTSPPDIAAPVRVIAPETAAAMQRLLAGVVAHGSGRAAAIPGRQVVGKTGTTQDYRDAWFVGCVGGLVMGVWLGNDNDSPMQNVSGGTLPTRLFHDIAVEAAKG